jgi:hypothetical protein
MTHRQIDSTGEESVRETVDYIGVLGIIPGPAGRDSWIWDIFPVGLVFGGRRVPHGFRSTSPSIKDSGTASTADFDIEAKRLRRAAEAGLRYRVKSKPCRSHTYLANGHTLTSFPRPAFAAARGSGASRAGR